MKNAIFNVQPHYKPTRDRRAPQAKGVQLIVAVLQLDAIEAEAKPAVRRQKNEEAFVESPGAACASGRAAQPPTLRRTRQRSDQNCAA